MKFDIIFAGVGGQGIISAATMLVEAASGLKFFCKQNEVHGMAQRGGAVVCHVRISNKNIWSDTIPKGAADFILATEPMEALRYRNYLSPNGVVIASNRPIRNIEYPDVAEIIREIQNNKRSIIIDAERLVLELKSERVVNIVMIGALVKELKIEGLRDAVLKNIEKRFSKKGEAVVALNKRAFEFGQGN